MLENREENKKEEVLGDPCAIRDVSEPNCEIDIPLVVLTEIGIHPDKVEKHRICFKKEKGRVYLEKCIEGFDNTAETKKDTEEIKEIKIPIDYMDHTEYIVYKTDQRGVNHLKNLLDPNKDQREFEQAEEIGTLTFYDGIVLVREIFHRIIDECFDSEDKDRFGQEYALYLYERMEDILDNNVLNYIRDQRAEHLHDLFIKKSNVYKRPAWMRNKNCIKPETEVIP